MFIFNYKEGWIMLGCGIVAVIATVALLATREKKGD